MENVFVNVRHADIHIDDAGAFSKDYKKGMKLLDEKIALINWKLIHSWPLNVNEV